MRILIISRTPWNNSNSFGNTFSNLFEGMADVEIFNICCQNGEMHNQVVKSAFQMTDKSVLHSIYKRKSKTGWLMTQKVENSENKLNQQLATETVKKRRLIFFMMRDWIWKLGRWKKDKELLSFLEQVKPDVIYLPIYASPYMCDVQNFVVDKLGVPAVGHISDDVYGCPPKANIFLRRYKAKLQKKLHKLIGKCSYLEVFAENMKEEYERVFNKPCYIIGKGINIENISQEKYDNTLKDEISFVYTGNIGSDRYKVLYAIGKAFEKLSGVDNGSRATLYIYSATALTKEMEQLLSSCACIQFMGKISRDEVDAVQKTADFLVHVESFSPSAIFSAKMSFSTKIIDYMMIGKPILAVGPKEVNSIQVLMNGLAIVATDEQGIVDLIRKVFNQEIDINDILNNVESYLIQQRNIKTIQAGIKERLDGLVEV